jgi:hypothetical protein
MMRNIWTILILFVREIASNSNFEVRQQISGFQFDRLSNRFRWSANFLWKLWKGSIRQKLFWGDFIQQANFP